MRNEGQFCRPKTAVAEHCSHGCSHYDRATSLDSLATDLYSIALTPAPALYHRDTTANDNTDGEDGVVMGGMIGSGSTHVKIGGC